MSQQRFVAIGECMVELRHKSERDLSLDFAGDTYNVSVYLARLQQQTSVTVSYFTALGDDPYSQMMLATWHTEQVNGSLVAQIPGKMPGLYFIRTDAQGERTFYYYRAQAAAREMMTTPLNTSALSEIQYFNFIYFSGITCAILDEPSRAKLFDLLSKARQHGAKICFDTNYRSRLWSTQKQAKDTITHFLTCVDIALPTYDDEQQLFSDATPEACVDRFLKAGIQEVILKRGSESCLIATQQQKQWIAAEKVTHIVDTTGAGDSFNAGYLAARFLNRTAEQAARSGHQLAAVVVTHPGGIIPIDKMPVLF